MEDFKLFKFRMISGFTLLALFVVIIILPFQAFGIVSYQPPAKTIALESFYLELNGSLFETTGRFDYLGSKQNLDEGSSFQKLDGELLARYGFGQQFDAWIGTRFRQNSSQTGDTQLTNAGIESYFIGLKYAFRPIYKRLRFALDTQFRITAYSSDEYPSGQAPVDNIILGDDGNEIWARGIFTFQRTNIHSFSGFMGVNLPPNDLSKEIIYNLETAFTGEHVTFLVGVNGVYSLGTDDFGDPVSRPSMSTGETNLFNSIDREYIAPFLGLNLAFKEVRFGIFGSKRIMGVSTDEGYEFKISFVWQTPGKSAKQVKIDKYKEYIIQASVEKVSSKGTFFKIDQGATKEVGKGMKFDVYKDDYVGGNKLIASGVVIEVGSNWAIIRVQKKYGQLSIKDGFTARGY